jgi:sensor domain CHASE-containing protein/GAF domain-containing protein
MLLRRKTFLLLLLTTVGMVAVSYFIFRIVLMGGFYKLERNTVQENIRRMLGALDSEVSNLETMSVDWAAWDDTYEFAADGNQEYITANFQDLTYTSIKLDMIILINTEGVILYGYGFDKALGITIPLPPEIQSQITATSVFGRPLTSEEATKGIYMLDDGPMMVVLQPIMTTDGSGPSRGTFIFGRRIDSDEIQTLVKISQLTNLTVERWDNPQTSADISKARDHLAEQNTFYIQNLDSKQAAGYAAVEDIYGNRAIILHTLTPRTISQQGQTSFTYLMIALALSSVVFGLVINFLLSRLFISPLAALNLNIGSAIKKQDYSVRIPLRGKDELTQQATFFNELVETLDRQKRDMQRAQEIQRRLAQSRAAGEIIRTVSIDQNPHRLLQQASDLIRRQFDLYYTGIFLVDENGLNASLQAGTEDDWLKPSAEGHRLTISEASTIGWTILHQQSHLTRDVDQETIRFSNPYMRLTRTELALPIIFGKRILGALTVQSTQANAFNEDDIALYQDIANDLAVALENTNAFQVAQVELGETRSLYAKYLTQAWADILQPVGRMGYLFENTALPPAEQGVSAVDIPISVRDQPIGHLTLESDEPLSAEAIALAENILNQAGLALESARLLETSRRSAARESLVGEIARRVRTTTNIETILRTSIQELGRSLRASEGSIRLDTSAETTKPLVAGGDGHNSDETPPPPSSADAE